MRFSLHRGGVSVVLALLVMLAGCAGNGSSGRSSEFDPFGFPREDTVVTAGVVGERPVPRRTPTEQASRVIPQMETETETIIRVQFYTTTNHREAEDVLGRASGVLNVPVAMEFDTPYYKLMAGPLPTREAADKLALRLRAMGYEAAWVVREHVSAPPK